MQAGLASLQLPLRATNSFEEEKNLPSLPSEMRRAISYTVPQTSYESDEDHHIDLASEISEFGIGHRTATLNGKHRRAIQTKQAWIKQQVQETSSTTDSTKMRRNKLTAEKLAARGGPRDQEFFKSFDLYLNETLN
jgi:hypothetical protein